MERRTLWAWLIFFSLAALLIGGAAFLIYSKLAEDVTDGDTTPGNESDEGEYFGPKIVFQHDDFLRIKAGGGQEFVPDMFVRWENADKWSQALDNTDIYLIHEQLFKPGAETGMGETFLRLLREKFGDKPDEELYKDYLRLILPALHEHNVVLQIHTIGVKGDFVPWDMYGTSTGADRIPYPKSSKGLDHVKYTTDLINSVSDELFEDEYHVSQFKLQSTLSGDWQRGVTNNVYVALEYMKNLQEEYPEMEFYLGDALEQRRDYDKDKTWRDAYQTLHDLMMNNSEYKNLNFKGVRTEFDKKWGDSAAFENNPGWAALAGKDGANNLIHSFGWEHGIEFNNPYAKDEWDYERLVLRTAEKSKELGLNWDFVVVHSDEGGGQGHGYPYDIFPEERGPNDPPTFSSVLNKVYDFYKNNPTQTGKEDDSSSGEDGDSEKKKKSDRKTGRFILDFD